MAAAGLAPPGASIDLRRDGGYVVARVSSRSPVLPGIVIVGEAVVGAPSRVSDDAGAATVLAAVLVAALVTITLGGVWLGTARSRGTVRRRLPIWPRWPRRLGCRSDLRPPASRPATSPPP